MYRTLPCGCQYQFEQESLRLLWIAWIAQIWMVYRHKLPTSWVDPWFRHILNLYEPLLFSDCWCQHFLLLSGMIPTTIFQLNSPTNSTQLGVSAPARGHQDGAKRTSLRLGPFSWDWGNLEDGRGKPLISWSCSWSAGDNWQNPKNRFLEDFRSKLALAMLRVDMGWSWLRVP